MIHKMQSRQQKLIFLLPFLFSLWAERAMQADWFHPDMSTGIQTAGGDCYGREPECYISVRKCAGNSDWI